MSMYLPNDAVRPTGAEAGEFADERPEAEPGELAEARPEVEGDDSDAKTPLETTNSNDA